MTLRNSDLQSDSDLDSIRNSCDVLIRLPSLIIKNVRGVLDEDQRQQFADIVTYFKENLTPLARDLAFLLGFYVKVLTDAKTIFSCHRSGCCGEVVGAVQNPALA